MGRNPIPLLPVTAGLSMWRNAVLPLLESPMGSLLFRKRRSRMRLINSSHFPTSMLRAMLYWVCRQYGMSAVKCIRQAQFTKCSWYWRGRAWSSGRILVRVQPDAVYPKTTKYPGLVNTPEYTIADCVEALVHVTAHEVCHIDDYRSGAKVREGHTDVWALRVLESFRRDREALMAKWMPAVPVKQAASAAPVASFIEKRSAKANADLERWHRRLRLAQGKVKKYKARVAYYNRKLGVTS